MASSPVFLFAPTEMEEQINHVINDLRNTPRVAEVIKFQRNRVLLL